MIPLLATVARSVETSEPTTYQEKIVALGPVAYWKLDEATNATTASDSIGSQDGSITGAVSGRAPIVSNSGGSYIFRRNSSDVVKVSPFTAISSNLSIVCSVKTAHSGDVQGLVCRDNSLSANRCWQFRIDTTGEVSFIGFVGGVAHQFTSTGTVNDGLIHHVAFVDNTTDNKWYIYIDGVKDGELARPGNLDTDAAALSFGALDGSSSNYLYLEGKLSEIAVYKKTLTAADVTALYALHNYAQWTPQQLFVFQWFDASQANTIEETSNNVSKWLSWGDLVADAGQTEPLSQPEYLSAADAVEFTASSEQVTSANLAEHFDIDTMPAADDTRQVFVVASHMNSDVRNIIYAENSTQTVYSRMSLYASSYDYVQYNHRRSSNPDVTTPLNMDNDVMVQAYWEHNGVDQIAVEHSGDDSTRQTVSADSTAKMQRAFIGLFRTPSGTYPSIALQGRIHELIIIAQSSLLSTADKQKVEGYLAHKWGLTSSLPSGHPYKSTPPTV